MNVEDGEKIM